MFLPDALYLLLSFPLYPVLSLCSSKFIVKILINKMLIKLQAHLCFAFFSLISLLFQ